jgi:hypothetical protein
MYQFGQEKGLATLWVIFLTNSSGHPGWLRKTLKDFVPENRP